MSLYLDDAEMDHWADTADGLLPVVDEVQQQIIGDSDDWNNSLVLSPPPWPPELDPTHPHAFSSVPWTPYEPREEEISLPVIVRRDDGPLLRDPPRGEEVQSWLAGGDAEARRERLAELVKRLADDLKGITTPRRGDRGVDRDAPSYHRTLRAWARASPAAFKAHDPTSTESKKALEHFFKYVRTGIGKRFPVTGYTITAWMLYNYPDEFIDTLADVMPRDVVLRDPMYRKTIIAPLASLRSGTAPLAYGYPAPLREPFLLDELTMPRLLPISFPRLPPPLPPLPSPVVVPDVMPPGVTLVFKKLQDTSRKRAREESEPLPQPKHPRLEFITSTLAYCHACGEAGATHLRIEDTMPTCEACMV